MNIIFSGAKNPSTEKIIKKMTGVNIIGRIDEEAYFDKTVIKKYAHQFKEGLETL